MSDGTAAAGEKTARRRVRLYWNHICILHNHEKGHLAGVRERLAARGIDLEVTFFGLGYATHMASYLARDDAELPDMVVSADLEVFEHPRVAAKLDRRYACGGWAPLKDTPAVRAARRDPTLLPAVIIPIVLYGTDCGGAPLMQVARERRLAFGGVNNSAGKTMVKAVWGRYGREAAVELLGRALVADMPIGAFRAVQGGEADVAAVPSLYAMRADRVTAHEGTAAEGPLLLPSYVCARDTVPEDVARAVVAEVLSDELLRFYVTGGDLIACDARVGVRSRYEDADPVLAVGSDALAAIDVDAFYDVYRARLPGAERI